ncbi:hypothetical protein [Corynebacterium terpenotabidum]|uniref:Uncharacterized protein n=1 Tax=Corynebacterium terpenotabidum Y-11 TaxID=1200352 RepID=S4XDW3_9CORY|nr:hypothetical protein [Corynebacterium terpenotabidum]AGP29785.1 hypothetical protein A606_00650 [Corynebacterium terpenotabidum Y-11]
MTNPFHNGATGPGPSWGADSSGRHIVPGPSTQSGQQPRNTSGFGSSPFGGSPGGFTSPAPSAAPTPVTFGPPASGPTGGFNAAPGPTDLTSGAPTASLTPVTGPWAFIAAATAAAVLGLLLGIAAPLTGSATDDLFHYLAIAGWVLAGIVTFILLGLHTGKDTKRQAESFYIGTPAQKTLYRVSAGLACVAVIITAVEIALWISKTVGA